MLLKQFFLYLLIFWNLSLQAENLILRENFKKAEKGDFLVAMQGKVLTLFRIEKNENGQLLLEETSIGSSFFKQQNMTFRNWFEKGASGFTAWHLYEIDLASGKMLKSYAFINDQWIEKPVSNSFLPTLLNLELVKIPLNQRKKIGRTSKNGEPLYWQPKLQFEGQCMQNISFDAWLAKWPNDKSELSLKTIEMYTPEDSTLYPAYLPYWLEVGGMVGNAKIRMIDSGKNLNSPHPLNHHGKNL